VKSVGKGCLKYSVYSVIHDCHGVMFNVSCIVLLTWLDQCSRLLRSFVLSLSCMCMHVVLLYRGEMSLVRLRAIWITNHPPSVL